MYFMNDKRKKHKEYSSVSYLLLRLMRYETIYMDKFDLLMTSLLLTTSMLLFLLIRTSSVAAFRVRIPTQQIALQIFGNGAISRKPQSISHYWTSSSTTNPSNSKSVIWNTAPGQLGMENIYQEWTLSQDQLLWDHRFDPTATLASRLGRGLRGTEQRLAKLRAVGNPAYLRLFAGGKNQMEPSSEDVDEENSKKKLTPSSEVLRRIQWDETLVAKDFSIVHYDRVDDSLVETPVDAPNQSISGKATKFIDALPEHRIVAIKYKERTVWDRATRFDCVFSGEGIMEVIQTYDVWKKAKDEEDDLDRQRRAYIPKRLQQILGKEWFDELEALWTKLNEKIARDPTISMKLEAEKYLKSSLDLFKLIWSEPEISPMPQWIPSSEIGSLELISEFVVLYPDTKIRTAILEEISIAMMKVGGKWKPVSPRGKKLPELNEKELTETYTRGTGPGGQKINKTSIRVCLVHEPTQLRVECQDTRSLQQNRKIARKRLQEKLDEYLNGNQSKAKLESQRASMKKVKAKARSRARIRDKQSSQSPELNESSDDEDFVETLVQ